MCRFPIKSWKEKVQNVKSLCKTIFDKYGGDDPAWLDDYVMDLIIKNNDDLDKIIDSLESLL